MEARWKQQSQQRPSFSDVIDFTLLELNATSAWDKGPRYLRLCRDTLVENAKRSKAVSRKYPQALQSLGKKEKIDTETFPMFFV